MYFVPRKGSETIVDILFVPVSQTVLPWANFVPGQTGIWICTTERLQCDNVSVQIGCSSVARIISEYLFIAHNV